MNTGRDAFGCQAVDGAGEWMVPTITSVYIDVPGVMCETIQIGSLTGSPDVFEEWRVPKKTNSSLTTSEAVTIMGRFLRMS